MKKIYLLGFDVGTAGCKSVIYTLDGEIASQAYREYALHHPEASWSVLQPEEVQDAIMRTIRESVRGISNPKDIEGLSVSTQGSTILPIDREGRPLGPAITWLDLRARPQRNRLIESLGRYELFKAVGQTLVPGKSLCTITWMRENEPKIYERATKFLLMGDFLIFLLTGNFATDYSSASSTAMLDVRKHRWSQEILDLAKINEELLPTLHPPGTVIGEVTAEASRQTGLPKGLPVVTGGYDQTCGSLGVGIIKEGPMMDSTGTAEATIISIDKPNLSRELCEFNYWIYHGVVKDKYIIMGITPTSGASLRWFRNQFGREEMRRAEETGRDAYDLLVEEAEKTVPASTPIFLPYLAGSVTPIMDPASRGVIFGLNLSHTRADIVRAILEGTCYELRLSIESLEAVLKKDIKELRVIGGGAKSGFWLRTKANITNKTIVVPQVKEAATLGAAILAGIGVKAYRSYEDAVEKTYKVLGVYEPDRDLVKKYARGYEVYKKIYGSLKKVFAEIEALENP